AADPVIAVTTGDEVTFELAILPVVPERHPRAFGVDSLQYDVLCLVDGLSLPSLHEVAGKLGLAVDHHPAIAKVDAVDVAVETEFHAVVNHALAMHSLAHARRIEQCHGAFFQDASAD